jgi:hypothetical protein
VTILHVGEASCVAVLTHDLPKAPGGTLQGCLSIQQNCRRETVVLVRAARTVAAGRRLAHVGIVRIEATPGKAMKDVTFEKDFRPTIAEEPAAGRLGEDHRPQCGQVDLNELRRFFQATLSEWCTLASK